MNNHLKSLSQILEEKSQQGWSGCLMIPEAKDISVGWKIYLQGGNIQYATSTVAQKERLTYLWQITQTKLAFPQFTNNKIDYQQLCQWSAEQDLPETELKQLLLELSKEALNQVLTIEQASIIITDECISGATMPNFTWQTLVQKEYIDSWRKVRTYLDSPLSLLYLAQNQAFDFYKSWKKITQNNSDFSAFAEAQKLSDFVNPLFEKICLYDLASRLNIDYLTMAKYLQTFLEQGLIKTAPRNNRKVTKSTSKFTPNKSVRKQKNQVEHPSIPKKNIAKSQDKVTKRRLPIIACIDDSKTVQTQVKMTLQPVGYRVISVIDATNALRELSRNMPVLILMDINMPDINGYDLCSMLKRSQKFHDVPIIMLTGRDGIIDRMRAKLVGADKYLTKPFDPQDLINMVRKNTLFVINH
ncbi:response regulator with CheY-like receiver domain and winged-helix DNA-binding domain [Xenococcus sp. PCC 7305]|uniref:response regulator n=1 Tax=Xenococcus sp. PCC 7305 TaxID=102125 RepID=UPI0002AC4DC3|nr:response regulator [Xenococcus sp. PCC 7305]ELS02990.1 response regulator with CheY-like receiver domain and winged-helix DNA-binding domain [Xenococcus sp. PCC 7305]